MSQLYARMGREKTSTKIVNRHMTSRFSLAENNMSTGKKTVLIFIGKIGKYTRLCHLLALGRVALVQPIEQGTDADGDGNGEGHTAYGHRDKEEIVERGGAYE